MVGEGGQRGDWRAVRDAARLLAPDHYVAALLASASQREDLIALAAFWGETGRIAVTVSDPNLGEIRLQWWADTLASHAPEASGHPVADAVRLAASRCVLDRELLQQLIEARRSELYAMPFAEAAEFDSYLQDTDGALFALCAQVRGLTSVEERELVRLAALAWGRVRVARDLPYFAAMGRLPVWRDGGLTAGFGIDAAEQKEGGVRLLAALASQARNRLIDLRNFASRLPSGAIDSVLPIALMEPYLRALETKARDPLRDVVMIAPLTRIIRMAWVRFRGRL